MENYLVGFLSKKNKKVNIEETGFQQRGQILISLLTWSQINT